MCKVKQKKSINFLEVVHIAQDIADELKCLREKAGYEFHQLYIFAQETAKAEDFILKTPRLTLRQTSRCNIAAETDEEHFRVGIFIQFLDNFIVALEARFTAHKSIIGEFQCLISADPTSGPTPQQIKSIEVLGKFYENDLMKYSGEFVPELIFWYRKIFRLNAAERPTDALSSIKECSSDAFPGLQTRSIFNRVRVRVQKIFASPSSSSSSLNFNFSSSSSSSQNKVEKIQSK